MCAVGKSHYLKKKKRGQCQYIFLRLTKYNTRRIWVNISPWKPNWFFSFNQSIWLSCSSSCSYMMWLLNQSIYSWLHWAIHSLTASIFYSEGYLNTSADPWPNLDIAPGENRWVAGDHLSKSIYLPFGFASVISGSSFLDTLCRE